MSIRRNQILWYVVMALMLILTCYFILNLTGVVLFHDPYGMFTIPVAVASIGFVLNRRENKEWAHRTAAPYVYVDRDGVPKRKILSRTIMLCYFISFLILIFSH